MKKSTILFTLLISVLVVLSSCNKGFKGENDQISLPPKSSMDLNFDSFSANTKSGLKSTETDTSYQTYLSAKGVVDIWSLVGFFTLAVPTASFYAAFNNEPELIADYTWEWKYSVDYIGATYHARLVGTTDKDNEQVNWQMFIKKDGIMGHDEFLWFEGTSYTDNSKGTWKLNQSYQFQNPLLKLEWTANATKEAVSSVKYTYVRENDDWGNVDKFNGSYMNFGIQVGALDAYFNAHYYAGLLNQNFVDVNIEWSTSAYNGRIKASHIFNVDTWKCWDVDGKNTVCE
ncbi:MAG: hypothetical protein IPO21_04140 [Bacteroidales bacterium]|nr:hypothetical protein [Bacteroidales bacterium]